MTIKPGSRLLISGCLLGFQCNYKGQASSEWQERPDFWRWVWKNFHVLAVCPEQLGGMTTPRIPSELCHSAAEILDGSGRVVSREGADVTSCFVRGAAEAVGAARAAGIQIAVMKTRSPSCGKSHVYDGTFSGRLVSGSGVTVRALLDAGLQVFDEQEFWQMFRGTFQVK